MFNIGLPEIGVVLLVVVIAVKPENLPDFLRKMRKLYRTIKDTINGFRADLHKVETSLQAELDSLDEKDSSSIKKVSTTKKTKNIDDTSAIEETNIDLDTEKSENYASKADGEANSINSDSTEKINEESVGISASNWYD